MEDYLIIFTRFDVVTKVPTWAKPFLNKGDLVWRIADDHVLTFDNRGLSLGKSYTKFQGYKPRPTNISLMRLLGH